MVGRVSAALAPLASSEEPNSGNTINEKKCAANRRRCFIGGFLCGMQV
jgi:hypothetical protein